MTSKKPSKDNSFAKRHIGPDESQLAEMLETIGVKSLEELIDETIPKSIRRRKTLNLPSGVSEYKYLEGLKEVAKQNQCFKS